MYPNFVLRRSDRCKVWVDGRYAERQFVELLGNPDRLFDLPGCQVIKDQRKIKVARIVVALSGEPQSLFVKRYNAFSLRHRFGSIFGPSGGMRSLRGASILRSGNIATAEPIAAVEERHRGVVQRSFFLSREISDGVTVDDYWNNILAPQKRNKSLPQRRVFFVALGSLFRSLHGQGIYHNDLKDANILAVPSKAGVGVELYLLDLEGVRRYHNLAEGRRIKNLVQLNRTLGRHMGARDRLAILRAYMGASFADRALRKRLIEKVILASDSVDATKALRR